MIWFTIDYMGYLIYYSAFILWFDHFIDSGAEICQIFRYFFGKFKKKSERHSEINWPLAPTDDELLELDFDLVMVTLPRFDEIFWFWFEDVVPETELLITAAGTGWELPVWLHFSFRASSSSCLWWCNCNSCN